MRRTGRHILGIEEDAIEFYIDTDTMSETGPTLSANAIQLLLKKRAPIKTTLPPAASDIRKNMDSPRASSWNPKPRVNPSISTGSVRRRIGANPLPTRSSFKISGSPERGKTEIKLAMTLCESRRTQVSKDAYRAYHVKDGVPRTAFNTTFYPPRKCRTYISCSSIRNLLPGE